MFSHGVRSGYPGRMAVEVEPPRQYFVSFVAVRHIAAEGQSGKMAPDMEVRRKQRCH
jgi:hypothetical protein